MQRGIGHILVLLLLLVSTKSFGQEEIVIAGVYKGTPLYIQNPYHPGLKNFCINSIHVNEDLLTLDYNLSAIKLDFKDLDLYTPVNIKIDHKNVCKPILVNKESILYHSSFKFMDLALNDSSMSWTTKGDRPGAVFEIEKLYADGWNQVETVNSSGLFQGSEYQYIPLLEEGANKYRIKYKVNKNRYLYSSELELEYYPEPVELVSATVANVVRLNRVSEYIIEDETGDVVLTGTGIAIDVRHLKAGEYYIFFDGIPYRFLKNTK